MGKLVAVFGLLLTLTLPQLAWAQFNAENTGLNSTAEQAFGPTVTNNSESIITVFIGNKILKPVLGLVGLIFLILTVYAGFLWMTAAGNEDQVKKAKNILITSITGAVIIAAAYVITNTVISNLTTGVSTAPPAGSVPPTPAP